MSWLNKIVLTCQEATLLMVKKQENAATLKEKIQMHLHLLFCAICRLFFKQTNMLDKHFHDISSNDELLPEVKMDEQKKAELQNKLSESLDI